MTLNLGSKKASPITSLIVPRGRGRVFDDLLVNFGIALDLDDVVIEHMLGLIGHALDIHGLTIDYEKLDGPSWGAQNGYDLIEENAEMYCFWASPHYLKASPVQGAVNGLRSLNTLGRVGGITARPKFQEKDTLGWINTYTPYSFPLGIHHSENPYHEFKGRAKQQIARELGVDVAIEDSAFNANEFDKAGIHAVLLDRPWNRKPYIREGVKRVFSWDQIVKEVTKQKNIKIAKAINARRVYR